MAGPNQAQVIEQEVKPLLAKKAIEHDPALERDAGFYRCYFIVPKKEGGLRLLLDLHQLNHALRTYRFKNYL